MSRVFLAREHGLGRPVVLKVLTPELAEGINADRFDREIRLAATLQQANIVPLLATGRAGRFAYYTMPFVDGRSLRERIDRDGGLPFGEGVSLLRDVARALAYAHERGVVHRDIKPGNVLLSGGAAVVTDFGIAKALTVAIGGGRLEGDGPSGLRPFALTATGMSLGTPAYMAPEQAAGDPNADHRADIYAFGCLAYEVFTGNPPFTHDAPHRVIARHFQETPRPVAERRPDVPPAIAALIARCLEKEPAHRPQRAADLLQALDAVSTGPTVVVARGPRTRAAGIVIALGALAAAGLYVVSRERRLADVAPAEPSALAAVPFGNVARDTALDYRVDGVRDELLTAMGTVSGIQIVARNAARRYRDLNQLDEREVERALRARFLVTGTYRQDNGYVVVSTQLNDSLKGSEIWSKTFRRPIVELGSLSGEISDSIAAVLRAKYGAGFGPQRVASTPGTKNPEALENYFQGQRLLRQRGTSIKDAIARFEAAIKLDPDYARAHAALATALNFLPFYFGTPVSEIEDRITIAAGEALRLDSTLADAYTAMALVHAAKGQWDKSVAESERAITLEPNNFEAHFNYGRIAVNRGHVAEALRHFADARRVERVSPPLLSAWTAYTMFLDGWPDSAQRMIEQTIVVDSMSQPMRNLGSTAMLAVGQLDLARRLAAAPVPVGVMSTAPYVLAKLGDTASANRRIDALESNNPRPWFTGMNRASVLLARGDTSAALDALEQVNRAIGPLWASFIPLLDPSYDAVRSSARFRALVRGAGLEPSLFATPVRPGKRRGS
jgi:serine/threonine-protein kinase